MKVKFKWITVISAKTTSYKITRVSNYPMEDCNYQMGVLFVLFNPKFLSLFVYLKRFKEVI